MAQTKAMEDRMRRPDGKVQKRAALLVVAKDRVLIPNLSRQQAGVVDGTLALDILSVDAGASEAIHGKTLPSG